MAAFAIAAGLHRRAHTGEGQFIDVAMLDSAVTLLNPVFNTFLATGNEPELIAEPRTSANNYRDSGAGCWASRTSRSSVPG